MSKRRVAVGLAVLSGIGLSACGGGGGSTSSTTETHTNNRNSASYIPPVQVAYLSNGTRLVLLENIENTYYFSNESAAIQDILEFCDGDNLIQETLGEDYYANGPLGASIASTVNFAPCVKYGRLTLQDFPPSSSERVTHIG